MASRLDIIQALPIGEGLKPFRDAHASANIDAIQHMSNKGLKNVLTELIIAFQNLQPALELPASKGRGTLRHDLQRLELLVHTDGFDLESLCLCWRPLLLFLSDQSVRVVSILPND
ncbi:hypothetical protein PMIN04_012687 [Paraphaeosphaeria minitans]